MSVLSVLLAFDGWVGNQGFWCFVQIINLGLIGGDNTTRRMLHYTTLYAPLHRVQRLRRHRSRVHTYRILFAIGGMLCLIFKERGPVHTSVRSSRIDSMDRD